MLGSAAGNPAQVSPQPLASGLPQKPEALATIARLSTLGSRKFGGAAKDPVLDSLCRLLGSVLRCNVSGAARRRRRLSTAIAPSPAVCKFFCARRDGVPGCFGQSCCHIVVGQCCFSAGSVNTLQKPFFAALTSNACSHE